MTQPKATAKAMIGARNIAALFSLIQISKQNRLKKQLRDMRPPMAALSQQNYAMRPPITRRKITTNNISPKTRKAIACTARQALSASYQNAKCPQSVNNRLQRSAETASGFGWNRRLIRRSIFVCEDTIRRAICG